LTRLEEAPLRLVEEDSHGSPWHEMFKTKAFKDNVSLLPDLKDKILGKNGKPTTSQLESSEKLADE
jgi:hypothetical protein